MAAKINEEELLNNISQTIKPGDSIIYAGTSWKNTRLAKGTYLGLTDDGRAVIEVPSTYFRCWVNDEGVYEQESTETTRKTRLHYNRVYLEDTPISMLVNTYF